MAKRKYGKLSVVIPVYNEKSTVESVIQQVNSVKIPLEIEIIVVDDYSTDGTRETLARENWPNVKVIFHDRNMGKGAALKTAFESVTGDIVLIQDADLEYNPVEYPKLLAPILDGRADVVYGSRFISSEKRVLFFWHSVGNKLLTTFSNMLSNLNLTDMETCYKVFVSSILKAITIEEERFGFEPEITAKIAKLKARIFEVGISYSGRTYLEGKKITWKDGVRAIWCILKYNLFRGKPIKDIQLDALESLQDMEWYYPALLDKLHANIGRRILEVGAGTGNLTYSLLGSDYLLCLEKEAQYVGVLKKRFEKFHNIEIKNMDFMENGEEIRRDFDTVIATNVLEHVEDDDGFLRKVHASLRDGGSVILIVPAHNILFSKLDKILGHFRRYSKLEIKGKLERAGFEVSHCSYANMAGAMGWLLFLKLLGRERLGSIGFFKTSLIKTSLMLEHFLDPPFGLSVIVTGRKPGALEGEKK